MATIQTIIVILYGKSSKVVLLLVVNLQLHKTQTFFY